jgi:hypothetical protein
MTNINLLKPKYSGHYCGPSEYQYWADTMFYLICKMKHNWESARSKLIDVTGNEEIEVKTGTGFSCSPSIC